MWIIGGPSQSVRELGVVAEQCSHCGRLAPCFVTGRFQGVHVYFITIAEAVTQAECLCSLCGGRFRCELWRYQNFIPPIIAAELTMEVILDRTNPTLRERLEWARQREAFAGDPGFVSAVQSLDRLRPGHLRADLQVGLRQWGHLREAERAELTRTATELDRALLFAETVTTSLPRSAGCLTGSLACLAVWSAFLWAPVVRNLYAGLAVGFAGFLAAGAIAHQLSSRRVRRWTEEVLIPEGENSGVDFGRFLAVLDDLPPPSPRIRQELDGLKEHEDAIRDALIAAGKVGDGKPAEGIRVSA